MHHLLFILISAILIAFTACKKKSQSYASFIQIGGQQVTVTDLSTVNITELDVDGDGSADFTFSSGVMPGGSLSYIYSATINSVHSSAKILYHSSYDTIFSGTLVTIDGVSPNINHTTYLYTGPENRPGTMISHFENPTVADYKGVNDAFQASNSFTTESVFLNKHHIVQSYNITHVSGDTTYREGFYSEALGDFYENEPYRYVGFKISEGNGIERLGWIKLKVTNYYQIQVVQFGIQDPL